MIDSTPKIAAIKVKRSGMMLEALSKQNTGTIDSAPIPTSVPPMLRARDSLERSMGSVETTLAIAPNGILVPV